MKGVIAWGMLFGAWASPAFAQQPSYTGTRTHSLPQVVTDERVCAAAVLPQVRLTSPTLARTNEAGTDATQAPSATSAGAPLAYVVTAGVVYIRFEALGVDLALAGGGASGCWSADLAGRAVASRAYADEVMRLGPALPAVP